jgi:hypothetical protein
MRGAKRLQKSKERLQQADKKAPLWNLEGQWLHLHQGGP